MGGDRRLAVPSLLSRPIGCGADAALMTPPARPPPDDPVDAKRTPWDPTLVSREKEHPMTTRTRETLTEATERATHPDDRGSGVRTLTAAILRGMPGDLDGAGEAMTDVIRSVSVSVATAPDDDLLVGASLAAGIAIGLLVGGGPRLLAAGAMVTSIGLGAALLGRRPGRSRVRLATTVN